MKQTITTSICSLSWIDERAGLPENDKAGPPHRFPGVQVTAEDDTLPFRFLNLLEAMVVVDGRRVLSADFTPSSRIYRNPSFLKISSEPFERLKKVLKLPDCAVFEQTVGARTVSPEVIAETAGSVPFPPLGPIGIPLQRRIAREIAHEFLGFPPIWTILRLKVFADGRSESELVCHSLFPSVSFYQLKPAVAGAVAQPVAHRVVGFYDSTAKAYDAVPNLDRWKVEGWGALAQNPSGACKGNPWGFNKNDLTVRPTALDHKLA